MRPFDPESRVAFSRGKSETRYSRAARVTRAIKQRYCRSARRVDISTPVRIRLIIARPQPLTGPFSRREGKFHLAETTSFLVPLISPASRSLLLLQFSSVSFSPGNSDTENSRRYGSVRASSSSRGSEAIIRLRGSYRKTPPTMGRKVRFPAHRDFFLAFSTTLRPLLSPLTRRPRCTSFTRLNFGPRQQRARASIVANILYARELLSFTSAGGMMLRPQ